MLAWDQDVFLGDLHHTYYEPPEAGLQTSVVILRNAEKEEQLRLLFSSTCICLRRENNLETWANSCWGLKLEDEKHRPKAPISHNVRYHRLTCRNG